MSNKKVGMIWLRRLYWLIPLALAVLQAIYILSSLGQIEVEEVWESIRGPYWFQNRLVFNGAYTNLGWYALLVQVYNIFGFDIHTAKFVKLALQIISLFCTASILKKYLGIKRASIPLVIVGLSPTALYFNTLQTTYGMDLLYFPICLYLITSINFASKITSLIKQSLAWVVAMIAWMSSPNFIFYLPLLAIIHLKEYQSKKTLKQDFITKTLLLSFVSFFTPLILGFAYIKNNWVLLNDPIFNKGIFRGNGIFELDLVLFVDNCKKLALDLFDRGVSYYVEIRKSEFSDIYPIIAIFFVLILTLVIFVQFKRVRLMLLFLIFGLVLQFILINLSGPITLGGLRRNISLLAFFYIIFCIAWYFITDKKFVLLKSHKRINQVFRLSGITILSFLLIHHIGVYAANLGDLKKISRHTDAVFSEGGRNSESSFKQLYEGIKKNDLIIDMCPLRQAIYVACPISSVYSAMKGACLWNHEKCKNIFLLDPLTKKANLISLDFWPNDVDP